MRENAAAERAARDKTTAESKAAADKVAREKAAAKAKAAAEVVREKSAEDARVAEETKAAGKKKKLRAARRKAAVTQKARGKVAKAVEAESIEAVEKELADRVARERAAADVVATAAKVQVAGEAPLPMECPSTVQLPAIAPTPQQPELKSKASPRVAGRVATASTPLRTRAPVRYLENHFAPDKGQFPPLTADDLSTSWHGKAQGELILKFLDVNLTSRFSQDEAQGMGVAGPRSEASAALDVAQIVRTLNERKTIGLHIMHEYNTRLRSTSSSFHEVGVRAGISTDTCHSETSSQQIQEMSMYFQSR